MKQIGIIGLGFMGEAILRGVRTAYPRISIGMVEKSGVRREIGMTEFGAADYTDRPAELITDSDLTILAIKPRDLDAVANMVRGAGGNALYLSVLAGTSIATLSTLFACKRIVRIMPNLAADIGRAVVGLSYAPEMQTEERELCRTVIDPLGTTLEVPEPLLAAVTGLSGSGIAFAFSFINALAMGGVAQGLSYATALDGAREVVASAAELLEKNGLHPEEMVSRVASPAGTTIAGLTALYEGAFSATVIEAVTAAAVRSREIER